MQNIIEALGGVAAVAQALGVRHGAVGNWRRRGWPDAAKWKLLKLARDRGIEVSLDELTNRLPNGVGEVRHG